jgi:hypothetical protein
MGAIFPRGRYWWNPPSVRVAGGSSRGDGLALRLLDTAARRV